jgi:cytochrome c-type biogenesis protein CcmH/NrfF
MIKLAMVISFFFMSHLGLSSALEEDLTPDQRIQFREISKDLRCPTCTGLSILESDAQFSIQMKTAVKEQVLAGKNKAEIMSFFTERYGLWILREPPKKGFHLIAWALPLSAMILGPFLLWFFVWRKRIAAKAKAIRPTKEILSELDRLVDKEKAGI